MYIKQISPNWWIIKAKGLVFFGFSEDQVIQKVQAWKLGQK